MINRTIGTLFLACAVSYGGNAVATPGAGKGASQAHPSSTPTCQGYGLGFLNKNITETVTAASTEGNTNLGQFWQEDAVFGPGPGASAAISVFFALDTAEGACETAFGLPPR